MKFVDSVKTSRPRPAITVSWLSLRMHLDTVSEQTVCYYYCDMGQVPNMYINTVCPKARHIMAGC